MEFSVTWLLELKVLNYYLHLQFLLQAEETGEIPGLLMLIKIQTKTKSFDDEEDDTQISGCSSNSDIKLHLFLTYVEKEDKKCNAHKNIESEFEFHFI